MPNPAERIYDAAAAALVDQQARADQITNTVGPLGAGAAAGTLLLKPALHGIDHANTAQLGGLVVGLVGIAVVLIAGIVVLRGGKIKQVEGQELVKIAEGPPELVDNPNLFHLKAAQDLGHVRKSNEVALVRLRALFVLVAAGLVLEVAGLAVAAEIQPASEPLKKAPAPSLKITKVRIRPDAVVMAGLLVPKASGSVRVNILFHGQNGRREQRVTRAVPLNSRGRFSVRILAGRQVRPLRSADYELTWNQLRTIAAAHLVGSAKRRSTG